MGGRISLGSTKDRHDYREKAFQDLSFLSDGDAASFLNAMEEFIIIIDPSSNIILFANDYAKGKSSDLVGKNCWQALGYKEPCCHNSSCLYKKTIEVNNEENLWKEHKITKLSLSHKTLIMESIRDVKAKTSREREKKLKNNLISMVSHELRTPLNIILCTIQLLEKYNENWKSPDSLKHTKRLKKATTQINKLLRDILLVEKVEANSLDFNPKAIDLVKLCRSIIEEVKESTEKSIDIVFRCKKESFVASVDEFLLTTIITNLLNNAMKYSPEDGEIILDLETKKDSVVFRIIDKGIGIPEAEQKNLFKSFYRASNVGSVSGTGLGLSIVKDFVEMHKGKIEFISKENKGTTFIVEIPFQREGSKELKTEKSFI